MQVLRELPTNQNSFSK